MLNARQIFSEEINKPILILAMEDISEKEKLEEKLRNYSEKLNKEVIKKTHQLEERINELEKMNKLMVDREIVMADLKNEVKKFKAAALDNKANKDK